MPFTLVQNTRGVTVYSRLSDNLRIEERGNADYIHLTTGQFIAAFHRPKEPGPLRVFTAHCELVIRGTAFSVTVEGGATRLVVAHGTVELNTPEETWLVSGGQQLLTKPGDMVLPATPRQLQEIEVFWPAEETPSVEIQRDAPIQPLGNR